MSLTLYMDGVAIPASETKFDLTTSASTSTSWSESFVARGGYIRGSLTVSGSAYFDFSPAKTGEDIVNDAIIDLMIREYVQGRRDGIDPA